MLNLHRIIYFQLSVIDTHLYPNTPAPPRFDRPSGPKPPLWGTSITLKHNALARTPLDEWSARRRDLYLTTHISHKRDIHAPGRIRTRNPSKRATADPRLRPRGQLDRLSKYYSSLISFEKRFTLNHYKATFTDMRRLTTGMRSEKCFVRRFRLCASVYLHKPR